MGKAIAELLATEGFDVGITFHTDEAGALDTQRAVEQRGQRCVVARHDAASPSTTEPSRTSSAGSGASACW